ncbi:MAG: cupin domain-containing protein [Planctomycetales bacterium]|nr:cupin domain-containing protein [Planctomycetales bacterium]
MARVIIADEDRTLTDVAEIGQFLEPHGIWYEHWPVENRLSADATNEEILAEFSPEIESLKQRGQFVTADVINVNQQTPNLDAMLAKFDKEHTHSEDEVRFTVAGRGVFHIHPESGPVFAVEVGAGDLINVPRGTKHWFNLCDDRAIRCIRLFQDVAGWTPEYVSSGVHGNYQPLCMGPNYLPSQGKVDSVIKL